MSAKGGSIGGIILGVVIAVVGIATQNYWLLFPSVFMVAGGTYGLAFQPQAQNPQAAKAQDVQFANAGEGFPVPVIFGEQKVIPNFMNWRADQFKSKSVSQSAGGKGGGSQVTGFDYYLTFEVGLCMGPIDEIGQVISVPGDLLARGKQYSSANGATATQSTITVTANKNVFVSDQIGATLLWADGSVDVITFVVDEKHARVATSATRSAQTFQIFSTPQQIVFDSTAVPTFATDTLTASANFSNFETVTIGGVVYRFRTSVTTTANDILIGANTAASLANLAAAINRSAGAGTTYGSLTLVNPYVTAANTSSTVVVTAIAPGTDGNAIVVSETCSFAAWAHGTLTGGTSAEYREFNLTGINEGGLVRLYRGSATQIRNSASDPYADTGMNYRNLCWALFINFKINKNVPSPKTYQFILRRFPRCIRDDGSTIANFETRGSANVAHAAFYQANPAACIYEIITNKVWGRGASSDIIDEASFIACSQYFKAKNIGVSFTLDSPDKLVSILDGVRTQLKTILSWDSGKWKLRCLMDPAQTSATILTLTSDDVEQLQVTRPLWPVTINQIRAEFNSKQKLYKADVVDVQNLANQQLTGRINPQHLALRIFTDWNIAARQAARILSEASYPAMSASFYINRFKSQSEIGDVIRLVWKEWGSATVTAYFLIMKLNPQGKKDDRIQVTATEDVFLAPVPGVESSVSLPPSQGWEHIVQLGINDLHLFQQPDSNNGEVFPVMALEAPAIMTLGATHKTLILGEQPSTGTIDIDALWAKQNSSSYTTLKGAPSFSQTGQLLSAVNHIMAIDRSALFFDFSLTSQADETVILGANQVVAATDNLELLPAHAINYMVIGEEIILVGSITKVDVNQYRVRNVIRGCFGSPISNHAIGELCFFSIDLNDGYDTSKIPQDQIIKFRAYPVTASGINQIGDDFFPAHLTPNNQKYLALGIRPLEPEAIAVTRIAGSPDTFTAVVRPRFYNHGGGTAPFFGVYKSSTGKTSGIIQSLVSSLGGMSFVVICYIVSGDFGYIGIPITLGASDVTFVPETMNSATSGRVTLANIPSEITLSPTQRAGAPSVTYNVIYIEIYSQLNNKTSVRSANFAAP